MAEEQKALHIFTELLAIPMGLFLIYVGTTVQTKGWIRLSLILIGLGNILIDGYMLTTW